MVVQFYQKSWPANMNCVCSHMNVPNDNMRRGRPMAGFIFSVCASHSTHAKRAPASHFSHRWYMELFGIVLGKIPEKNHTYVSVCEVQMGHK